jgi:hypothetical protein
MDGFFFLIVALICIGVIVFLIWINGKPANLYTCVRCGGYFELTECAWTNFKNSKCICKSCMGSYDPRNRENLVKKLLA